MVEVYAKKVLNADSEIAGIKEAAKASKFFLKMKAVYTSSRTVDICAVLSVLVSRRTLLMHVVRFLGIVNTDSLMIENCPHVPFSR